MYDPEESHYHQFFNTHDEFISLFEKAGSKVIVEHGICLKSFTEAQIDSLELDDNIYNALAETVRDLPRISSSCMFILSK